MQSRRQVCPEKTVGPWVEGASRVTSPDSPEDGPPPEALVGVFENGCRCGRGIPASPGIHWVLPQAARPLDGVFEVGCRYGSGLPAPAGRHK